MLPKCIGFLFLLRFTLMKTFLLVIRSAYSSVFFFTLIQTGEGTSMLGLSDLGLHGTLIHCS